MRTICEKCNESFEWQPKLTVNYYGTIKTIKNTKICKKCIQKNTHKILKCLQVNPFKELNK